jgi:hypothetical protein
VRGTALLNPLYLSTIANLYYSRLKTTLNLPPSSPAHHCHHVSTESSMPTLTAHSPPPQPATVQRPAPLPRKLHLPLQKSSTTSTSTPCKQTQAPPPTPHTRKREDPSKVSERTGPRRKASNTPAHRKGRAGFQNGSVLVIRFCAERWKLLVLYRIY